jgi:hypothetical protein
VRFGLGFAVVALVGTAHAAERPSRARLCPENLPEGVRLPPQPGCTDARPAPTRRDGTYDLGNGTSVRIGGRASAEFGVRR